MDTRKLLAGLISDDAEVRRKAAEETGETRCAEAVPHLVELLKREQNGGVLEAAGDALAKFPASSTAQALTPLLRSDDPRVRNLVCEVLAAIGEPAVDVLVALFSDPDKDIRKFAVDVAGDIRSPRAIPALVNEALNDSDPNVVLSALESFGKIGDASAVEPIIQTYKKGPEDVIFYCLTALGRIGGSTAVSFLCSVVKEAGSPIYRCAAVESLGEIRDEAALETLLPLLSESDEMLQQAAFRTVGRLDLSAIERHFDGSRDERLANCVVSAVSSGDEELRDYGFTALRAIGARNSVAILGSLIARDNSSLPQIVESLGGVDQMELSHFKPLVTSDNPSVREAVAGIMADSASPVAAEIVNSLLADGESTVRAAAAAAAGRQKNLSAVPQLIALLNDEESMARSAAAQSLGILRAKEAVPRLAALLDDPERSVLEAVGNALALIDGEDTEVLLINALHQENPDLREKVIYLMGLLPSTPRIRVALTMACSDPAWTVRRAAANALARDPDEDLPVPTLAGLLRDAQPKVRIAAVKALGAGGGSEALEALVPVVNDEDTWVRYEAVRALGKFSGEKAVNALITSLVQSESIVQIAACEALAALGERRAAEPIRCLLKLEDPEVREAAAKALEALDGSAPRAQGEGGI